MSTDDPVNTSYTGTTSNSQGSTSPSTTGSTGGSSGVIPSDAEQRLRGDLNSAADTAKSSINALKSEAQQQAGELRHRAEEQAGQLAGRAKSFASEKKDLAADQLSGVASVITRVADQMEGENQPTVAGYARDIANSIQRVSDTVKQRDIEDIFSMVQDFGRRQPMVFLGAAALMGFAASRFIMSSNRRRSEMGGSGYNQSNNYRSGMSAAYGSDERPSGASSSYGGSSGSSNYGGSSGSGTGATSSQVSDRQSGASSSTYSSSGSGSSLGTTGGSV